MEGYLEGNTICRTMGETWMFFVQPHGSYSSWTPSFSDCWDPRVPLVRRKCRSAAVSGAWAQSISIDIGSLNDVVREDLAATWGCTIGLMWRRGDNLEVARPSWRSSKTRLSQLITFLMACDNEVGSKKFSSRFLTSLRGLRQKWSQRAWSPHWTSHANCLNSYA